MPKTVKTKATASTKATNSTKAKTSTSTSTSTSTKAASFEEFLQAPSRLAEHPAKKGVAGSGEDKQKSLPKAKPLSDSAGHKPSARKEKVGLTLDSEIIDAIDDYIYHARKQGKRLKKNDVYDAALRQFLGLGGGEAQ